MQHTISRRAGLYAIVLLVIFAVVIYGADQFTKYLVVENMTEGESFDALGPFLQIFFIRNPGAAFSIASGSTWIFSLLAAVVTIFIVVFARRIRSRMWAIVFGLLLGGVLGNLTDRLVRPPAFGLGHVIDFVYTPWLLPAIYNIADMAIVSSMILLVILVLVGVNFDGSRVSSNRREKVVDFSEEP